LVDHVKAFIESVCLTIMGELRQPVPSSTPSTTDLLVAALNPLGLRNSRGASKLDKVLSGFNKLADALSDMRNANGPIAHGKDAFLDALTADHARAFLHTGDAILGVLLHALDGKQPDLTVTREPYESFPHLNDKIDRAVIVSARIDENDDRQMVVFSVATGPREEAIELRVEPSRLLYGIDREAYVEVLRTAELALVEVDGDEAEQEAVAYRIQVAPSLLDVAIAEAPLAELVTVYRGPLESLRKGLEAFLVAEGIDTAREAGADVHLIDSLLGSAEQNMGLDWKQREPLQARLKVASKRVLVHFEVSAETAEQVAEHLVAWLRVQAPDADSSRVNLLAASAEVKA
jgi:hypothetical protein